ncbi:amidophosphoribosyltransferase [Candidatus Sumerlaeota bacterium]|nr:amidophosphoribosyltransferase [Candidatus Sumerlaeota bacterium]
MPGEECGVVAVIGHPEAAKLAYLGLYALQHRGQESAGIVSSDGENLICHKNDGLVADVFTPEAMATLKGSLAIGHVRYSTTGATRVTNAQPIWARYGGGQVAVAHNGNLTNSEALRYEQEQGGAIFQTTTDTEIIVHGLARRTGKDFHEALWETLKKLKGAFSLVILRPDEVIAVKDPRGFRPLCLGMLEGGGYVVSSESCALEIMDAAYMREFQPGEAMIFGKDGSVRSIRPFPPETESFCIFEYIYFSRPDSFARHARSVSMLRARLGAQLAKEHPVDADVVIAVPDSSVPAAIGYARESGIPYDIGLVRSHYIGRTFIEPEQSIRDFGARIKYNPVRAILQDKRVVVVDDSIVRGTTSRKIVNILRNAGAKEIHFRITAPPWKYPCYFGIDTPEESQLLGANKTIEEMREYVGSDSLGFISIKGLVQVMPKTINYCLACFNGVYPEGQEPQCEFSKNRYESHK